MLTQNESINNMLILTDNNLTIDKINLTLEDIYHPTLVIYYNYSLLISSILTTIFLIPAIYVVLTQSKKAQVFKYLLLNQLIWSYLFCAILVAEGIVPLFPIPAIYFSSIFKYFGPEKMNIILPLHLFISVGHTQSYFLACLYRVSYASAFNKFQAWFEDPRKLEAIVMGLLLVFSGIIVAPFLFLHYDAIQLRQNLLNQYQPIQELLPYESFVIASPLLKFPTNNTILTIALNSYTIYVPFTFLVGFTIFLIFLRQAFIIKNFMSTATYHNYLIVVRAKSVQIASVSMFLFIPYLIQFIVFLAGLKNASLIALLAHFPASYHLFFEILALFYFVKPYREYWVRVFGKVKKFYAKSEECVKVENVCEEGNVVKHPTSN